MSERVIDQRFVLLTEYKRGGIGTVWKARDLQNLQVVALKLLHDTSSEQAQRFVREAGLLSELDDPGIVRYVAHGTSDGDTPYLCMEWLEGENLAERLARGSLGLRESLQVMESALRGLRAAHGRGLTHRDLKPSNLFLRAGRLDDVVLLDLGMARYAADSRQLTRSGTILGTPSYMAPEQATGETGARAALDVFALGCVWFECLTGAPPFAAPHMVSLLAKLLFEEPPRLRELRPELPESLERLLEQMLAKDPARRLHDAAAVRVALHALAELADVPPRTSAGALPSSGAGEQELVSVIMTYALAADSGEGSATLAAPGGFPDVAAYGGEWKRLADGTELIVLGQRAVLAAALRGAVGGRSLSAVPHGPGGRGLLRSGRRSAHAGLPLRHWIVRAQRAAGRDAAAAESLASARDALSRRAARIADPAARERFLRGVPEHAQLLTE